MTETKLSVTDILRQAPAFRRLSAAQLNHLATQAQPLRYRMGQPMLRRETLPHQIALILEGQARLIGYDPQTQAPITLKRLERGELLGIAGLIRGIPCETAIASSEVTCLTFPAPTFLTLLLQSSALQAAVRDRCLVSEAFELMGYILQNHAEVTGNLRELANRISDTADVRHFPPGSSLPSLASDRIWVISSGSLGPFKAGDPLPDQPEAGLTVGSDRPVRLIGFESLGTVVPPAAHTPTDTANPTAPNPWDDIPYASATISEEVVDDGASATEAQTSLDYPYVRGSGPINGTLACFAMISQHFNLPFRRDVVQRILTNQLNRSGLSLQLCGAIAEMLGLKTQLVKVPVDKIHRLPTPAIIPWNEGLAVLFEANQRERVLGLPEIGVVSRSTADFEAVFGESNEALLLETTAETPRKRFGLSWFIPSLKRYRVVLIEVFIASFFVQLFGLANPLMVQVIIDRVIVQNSIDTLQVLGIFLVVVAIFEALLSSLRTYLFVDTTNRIDMALGSEIIDHLLRLPLRYFDRRPVGELASRVNELENIRQFLTGTALTVVLDAIFSVLYIVVMLFYSWILTLVALLSIPFFIGLTLVVSPIVRRQLRTKAERNAATQSYLVEALSGIQTVKAQNIELKTRWQWQDRYARYVSAGFQNVLTSTAAGSTSNFLNKMSALLVLWVGAYLVLQGQLTLGQLIAFRIISGYVTAPLLRLAQIWQNFQETALSLERLSDILDHPQEADEDNRNQIPMPAIEGRVRYENLSFRFAASGPLQLANVTLEFEPGHFIGIVGQSGSGKSTLMKLLPRLYEPESGRILIDKYDIAKVELYSLRQQVGIVPQDSLLFEGSIQENIALTNPDADVDAIVEAAKVACAHDFIMDMSIGYNTRVGERGSSLSGGQRQRIAIARTVLQNPHLLILDEATSALDYDTERQVSDNLMRWSKGRTVFFITHRLNTIRNADQILVMDKGAAVEQGTHNELMDLKGRYYCLYQQQTTMA